MQNRVASVLKPVFTLEYCLACGKACCGCHDHPMSGEAATMKLVLYWHNVPTINGYPMRDSDCAACQRKVQPFYNELHLCEKKLLVPHASITPDTVTYYLEQSEEYIEVKCERCGGVWTRPEFPGHPCLY